MYSLKSDPLHFSTYHTYDLNEERFQEFLEKHLIYPYIV